MKVFDKVKEYILMQLPVSGDKVTMDEIGRAHV